MKARQAAGFSFLLGLGRIASLCRSSKLKVLLMIFILV